MYIYRRRCLLQRCTHPSLLSSISSLSRTTIYSPHSPRSILKQAHGILVERSKRMKLAAEMGLVRYPRGRHWSRALRRGLLRGKGTSGCGCKNEAAPSASSKVAEELGAEENADDPVEIESRVRALQKLVPGGEELGMEWLLEETADYIEALQGQVTALAFLLDGLEREKKMMGR